MTTQRYLWFLSNLVAVRLGGSETGGRYALVEVAGPPGDQPPLHLHREDDEIFHVLEGEMTLHQAGEAPRKLGAGETAFASRGVPHTYVVDSDEPARWLVLSAPARFDALVEEFAEPAERPELPTPSAPPDFARLVEICARYGVEILGPPGSLP
jgi:quercetin dioxygenase-like cupin family protein